MSGDELLPCPFCGDNAAVQTDIDDKARYCACLNGDCSAIIWQSTLNRAISAWNSRSVTPQKDFTSFRGLTLQDIPARDDKLFDGKTYQASDDYIKGWEDSRAFQRKIQKADIDAPADNRYTEGYRDAVREANNGWISVDERLPECLKLCLVFMGLDNPLRTAFYDRMVGDWLEPRRVKEMPKVTHWRPLPPPPDHIADANKKVCDGR